MKIKAIESLERKAAPQSKNLPEGRRLEREKLDVAKGLASGKYTMPQARVLKSSLHVMRRLLMVQEMYKIMRSSGRPAQTTL